MFVFAFLLFIVLRRRRRRIKATTRLHIIGYQNKPKAPLVFLAGWLAGVCVPSVKIA